MGTAADELSCVSGHFSAAGLGFTLIMFRRPHAGAALAAVALVFPIVLAAPAYAQEAVNGRYVMTPTAEGFLKLDSRTGEVSDCRRSEAGFRCMVTPDERGALQAEIDRLAKENAGLRQSLASAGLSPPGPDASTAAPAPPSSKSGPSDEEFDRAMTLMERFMRRFMALMRDEPGKPNGL
jgi:hypothetical protein